uniref:Uncharacterized protein n=1 Tax=Arundo donax TaxID=35708 RepID=A0A0A9H833_ARUDO
MQEWRLRAPPHRRRCRRRRSRPSRTTAATRGPPRARCLSRSTARRRGPLARSSRCSRRSWCSPCCPASSGACARGRPRAPTSGTTARGWPDGGAGGARLAGPPSSGRRSRRPWRRCLLRCHRLRNREEAAAARFMAFFSLLFRSNSDCLIGERINKRLT